MCVSLFSIFYFSFVDLKGSSLTRADWFSGLLYVVGSYGLAWFIVVITLMYVPGQSTFIFNFFLKNYFFGEREKYISQFNQPAL